MNKYQIAIAAFLLHLCIGSVYGWSCLILPIANTYNYSITAVQLCFSIAIFFLGTNTCFAGNMVERLGPRKSGLLSTILFSTGMIATGLILQYNLSLYWVYLFYGVVLGSSLGIGYIAPISSLLLAFPRRKAFGGSIAIFGFGLGAMLFAPIATRLLQISIPDTFILMGISYFIIMLCASLLLPKKCVAMNDDCFNHPGLTRKEAIRTVSFKSLWIMLFINIFCGISLVSIISPFCQSVLSFSVTDAAIIVAIVGLFNGIGRPIWAMIADDIGLINAYRLIFILQTICCMSILIIVFSAAQDVTFIKNILYLLATMYGAGFAMAPAMCQELFGIKHVSAIHGAVLFSWAVAGLLGPVLVTTMHNLFGTYIYMFYLFICLYIVALYHTFNLKIEY